jgi:tetratricopeptide (TPR) repeat protein
LFKEASMRTTILGLVLALTAVSPAVAISLSDGVGSTGTGYYPGLATVTAAQRNVTRLADAFDKTASFGNILEVEEELREILVADRSLHSLLAAAHAAAGDIAAARSALERAGQSSSVQDAPPDAWAAIARALIARRTGQLDVAAVEAAQAISADPDNAYAHNVAGTVAVIRGDMRAAADHFEAAVARAPEGAAYLANLGAVRVDQRLLRAADAALTRALRLAPGDCTALIASGRLLTAVGDLPSAAASFTRCLDSNPNNTVAALGAVQALIDQGALTEADSLTVRASSAFAEPSILRAHIAMRAAAPQEAADRLAEAGAAADAQLLSALVVGANGDPATGSTMAAELARGGNMAAWPAHHGLAVASDSPVAEDMPLRTAQAAFFEALSATGGAAALRHLREAAGVTPDLRFDGASVEDAAALTQLETRKHVALGMVMALGGYRELAITAYRRALDSNPSAALVHLLLGHGLLATDAASAEAALTEALRQSPHLWLAHRDIGTLQAGRGNFEAAMASFNAASEITRNADILLLLGAAAEAVPDKEAALAAYESMVELAPTSSIALNQLAWFLVNNTDDTRRSLDLAEEANRLNPGSASILDTLGWAHFHLGEWEPALDALRQAYEIDQGRRPEIGLRLATVAIEAGNNEEARNILSELDDGRDLGAAAAYVQQLRDRLPE